MARKRSVKWTEKPKQLRAQSQYRATPPPRVVVLTVAHTINGKRYGPGTVTVPSTVAQVLIEQERNFHAVENALRDQRPMATVIGGNGRIWRVPDEHFGAVLAREMQS